MDDVQDTHEEFTRAFATIAEVREYSRMQDSNDLDQLLQRIDGDPDNLKERHAMRRRTYSSASAHREFYKSLVPKNLAIPTEAKIELDNFLTAVGLYFTWQKENQIYGHGMKRDLREIKDALKKRSNRLDKLLKRLKEKESRFHQNWDNICLAFVRLEHVLKD